MITTEELLAELREQCRRAGSQKEWAAQHHISEQYLSHVLHGREEPGKSIAEAVGYRRVAMYEKITKARQ